MSCPDLDNLLAADHIDETAAHIETCADCRRLVEMTASIGGDFGRGRHCDEADVMIAAHATNSLRPADQTWLLEHLSGCRHCATVARSVLLDPPSLPSTPLAAVGSGVVRLAIPIVAIAAVVVFALVAITRLGGDGDSPDTVTATLPVESDDGRAAQGPDTDARAVEAPPQAALDAGAVASRDTGEGGKTASLAEQRAAHRAIQAAVKGGSLAAAFDGCDKVRRRRWIKKCLALACRAGDKPHARRYLARLPKKDRDQFVNLCMAQGVEF